MTPAARLAEIRHIIEVAEGQQNRDDVFFLFPKEARRIYRLTATPKPRRARKGRKS